jgi:hypothetical protein
MDKNAIKKYATWARTELITRVTQRAEKYGISADADPKADTVRDIVLTSTEKKQRAALIQEVKEKGFDQVMEEVAYTWFNRFSALRFMEVNNYLPSRVRVFTDDNNEFKPQILTEAIHIELEGLDMEKVYALKESNNDEELYKYLIITQCNALSKVLPGMFQKIADYTELLFPDNLLREGGVIQQMIELIPQEDWKDQVQIVGWLYQYYITDEFDSIYDGNMSRDSVTADKIPAATQIFTPDWVVKTMVENSLGKMWIEGHKNSRQLASSWEYYLYDEEQKPEVQKALSQVYSQYEKLNPTTIKCIDPCMGSGHILLYIFDVLMDIYRDYGYSSREAVLNILNNNIYGLDIDKRATQLAEFSLAMKGRQYDRNFFSRNIRPHVQHFQNLSVDTSMINSPRIKKFARLFYDANEYGSLLNIEITNDEINEIEDEIDNLSEDIFNIKIIPVLRRMLDLSKILTSKYDVVITNPPYLGNKRFNNKLSEYIKKYHPDAKADLAMAMLDRLIWGLTKTNGFCAAVTTVSWMYLKNFSDFRRNIVERSNFVCLIDYGTELFEGKIGHLPIVSWVCRNGKIKQNFPSIRLVDYCYSRRDEKLIEYHNLSNRYITNQNNLLKIDGMPIAYWLTDNAVTIIEKNKSFDEMAVTRAGMITGNNNTFVRQWYEIDWNKANTECASRQEAIDSHAVWFPYSKGGDYRKWYGNNECVVNWYNDGNYMRNLKDDTGKIPAHAFNLDYIFKTNICWNSISTNRFSARLTDKGFLYDAGGSFASVPQTFVLYYLGLLNSVVAYYFLTAFNPTLNFQKGNVGSLPVILNTSYIDRINKLVSTNIKISKRDWDTDETSWGFTRNSLILKNTNNKYIQDNYKTWVFTINEEFKQLKTNEIELNNIFIDIYNLQKELSPIVADKEITIRMVDLNRDIKAFISYAVGCMLGRYSLDQDGLVYAGGQWDPSKYKTFPADKDGILPICDDEYFDDDITGLFIDFVRTVYGADTLEENLQFIADALGGDGSPREVIRKYFLNDFYADHLKMYKKCPIYWLFDSGKKNGFKCLIYMHRYQPDTIARIRTDYVHEQQARYRTAISGLERQLADAPTSERVHLNNQLKKLKDQAEETRKYEEKIHHLADQMISIDLDDGVKHNYAIFQDVLAKIK